MRTNLRKLPKGKVTVGKLLDLDDIQAILRFIDENKAKIESLIVAVQWRDGSGQWVCNDANSKDVFWLLAQINHQLMEESLSPREE